MPRHRNLVANARQAAAWFTVVRPGRGRHAGVAALLPLVRHAGDELRHHEGRQAGAGAALRHRHGAKAIAKEKPTLFPGVPRMYIALNEDPTTPKYDLASLKACVSGAAPLPMAVAQEFERITGGAKVVEGYGLTECSPVTHANPLVGERSEGSIGMPLPDTDVRLVDLDEPDREVAQGERGEMCIQRTAGDARVLEQARGDRPGDPQRLAAHGRRRGHGRRRLLPDRGPDQGHGHRVAGSTCTPPRSRRCSTSTPRSRSAPWSACPTRPPASA